MTLNMRRTTKCRQHNTCAMAACSSTIFLALIMSCSRPCRRSSSPFTSFMSGLSTAYTQTKRYEMLTIKQCFESTAMILLCYSRMKTMLFRVYTAFYLQYADNLLIELLLSHGIKLINGRLTLLYQQTEVRVTVLPSTTNT